MATCIHGLNVQVNIIASQASVTCNDIVMATQCVKLKPSPGDGLADQGHGGERRESGVARGVETPRAGQTQHRGRRGQGQTLALMAGHGTWDNMYIQGLSFEKVEFRGLL